MVWSGCLKIRLQLQPVAVVVVLDEGPKTGPNWTFKHYLSMGTENVKDSLLWWVEKQAMYPHLSRMARNYLSIPGMFSPLPKCYYMLTRTYDSHLHRCRASLQQGKAHSLTHLQSVHGCLNACIDVSWHMEQARSCPWHWPSCCCYSSWDEGRGRWVWHGVGLYNI